MSRISIQRGDITQCTTDAIVNAANTSLLGGGGVDGAIHRAAGPELLAECRTLGGCKTGSKANTSISSAMSVCHSYAGTDLEWWTSGEDALLASCYRNSLAAAAGLNCKTVAFPSISTGVYHFPLNRAAEIAIRTIEEYLSSHPEIRQVTMICFDAGNLAVYQDALAEAGQANHV